MEQPGKGRVSWLREELGGVGRKPCPHPAPSSLSHSTSPQAPCGPGDHCPQIKGAGLLPVSRARLPLLCSLLSPSQKPVGTRCG